MATYSIMTPPIKSSGNRIGTNLLVTSVNKQTNEIRGPEVGGQERIEMQHGDLLLNIRPSGLAKSGTKFASLFAVIDQNLHLLMCADWPSSRDRIARRIIAYQESGRHAPVDAPAKESGSETSAERFYGEQDFCVAVSSALDAGLTCKELVKLCLKVECERIDKVPASA